METEKNESGNKKMMLGVAVFLMLALCVVFYYLYTSNKENDELTAEKTQLDISFKNLSDTLNERSVEIQQITDHNTLLDSTVTAKQAIIDAKKKQITGLLSKAKMSKVELVEAKKMIAEYEADIAELQKQVDELCAQNELLAKENIKLELDLSTEKKTTMALTAQNKGLSKTVEVGSLLPLTLLQVEGVKQRANGRDRAVKKAKMAESIKISFETGENKILPKGAVSLYVRVINPKGETISVANQGSGTLTLAESNSQVEYSTKADIDWNQANKKVSVYWKQFISAVGNYKVEIYQSGYLIGKGDVTLD